jgi:hypothetical protein
MNGKSRQKQAHLSIEELALRPLLRSMTAHATCSDHTNASSRWPIFPAAAKIDRDHGRRLLIRPWEDPAGGPKLLRGSAQSSADADMAQPAPLRRLLHSL